SAQHALSRTYSDWDACHARASRKIAEIAEVAKPGSIGSRASRALRSPVSTCVTGLASRLTAARRLDGDRDLHGLAFAHRDRRGLRAQRVQVLGIVPLIGRHV